jgi:UDP-glucose 4-epimerase
MQNNSRILVTGSDGFIGKHLVSALVSRGHTVFEADKKQGTDLSIKETVDALPDVDIVVHLAAYNGTKHFYNYPLDVIRDSVLPTQFLLDRYAGKVKRFVFSGSCESYAGTVDVFGWTVPTNESVPLSITDTTNPRWSYGGSKLLNELQVTAAHSQLGQEYTILRYHNVYGPGQVDHFIPEFVSRVKQGDYSLSGWNNTRSFMYIDDAVQATEEILFSEVCANKTLNVGSSDERTIKEVATMILKEMQIDQKLILKAAPLGSVSRRCPDLRKLEKLLNFKSKISLKDGIRKTLGSL